jgi:hypothetical protein
MDRRGFLFSATTFFLAPTPAPAATLDALPRQTVALVGLDYASCSTVEGLSETSRHWVDRDRFKLNTFLSPSSWVLARRLVEERMRAVPPEARYWNTSMDWVGRELRYCDACILLADLGYGFEFELDALSRLSTAALEHTRSITFVGLKTWKLDRGLLTPDQAWRVRNAMTHIRSVIPRAIIVDEPVTEAAWTLEIARVGGDISAETLRAAMAEECRNRRNWLAAPIVRMLARPEQRKFRPFPDAVA